MLAQRTGKPMSARRSAFIVMQAQVIVWYEHKTFPNEMSGVDA
jgi:hypothetical protein